MSQFTLENLQSVLREEAGAEIGPDALDVPFLELGYDSLAMIQVTTAIQTRYGIPLPDDATQYMTTPRATLEYVNSLREPA